MKRDVQFQLKRLLDDYTDSVEQARDAWAVLGRTPLETSNPNPYYNAKERSDKLAASRNARRSHLEGFFAGSVDALSLFRSPAHE